MNEVIGAKHEFHDEDFVAGWADRFLPTAERLKLFNVILTELQSYMPTYGCIVELGIGPGYLADYILRAMPDIEYCGVDFSAPMVDIARQRLTDHSDHVTYVQADLVKDKWWKDITMPVNAIVSTWTLHDLASQKNVEEVYKSCLRVLQGNGLLLNGDFIKPDEAIHKSNMSRDDLKLLGISRYCSMSALKVQNAC